MANTAKKEEKVVQMGSNFSTDSLNKKLVEISDKVKDVEDKIQALQSEKQGLRDKVPALGISKKAFDRCHKMRFLDKEDIEREIRDDVICKQAFGLSADGVQFEFKLDDLLRKSLKQDNE